LHFNHQRHRFAINVGDSITKVVIPMIGDTVLASSDGGPITGDTTLAVMAV